MEERNEKILSDQEIQKLEECIKSGFSDLQAVYETEIAEERFNSWFIHGGGADLVKRWRVMSTAPALKMFHAPTNHREAEAVLKRHPLTKKDYSDRTEHTGAEGKDLQPILVKFIDEKSQA